MYAIVRVVYGVPLVSNTDQVELSEDLEDAIDWQKEAAGFLTYYSGCAPEIPAAFGVSLGKFDEGNAFVEVSTLPLIPTEEQQQLFRTRWDALEPAMQQEITAIGGAPRVIFLWSTS